MTRTLLISRLNAALLIGALLSANSSAVYAAPPAGSAAILHAPRAMVNGEQVERSTVLFQGDRVRTGSSIASLDFSGSLVLMAKDSTALLEENQLNLICGGAIVKTLTGMSARAGNLVMKPAGQAARFELIRTEKSLRITALDGDLQVSDGRQSSVLKKGRQMDLSCTECMQDAASPQNTVSGDSGSCSLSNATTGAPRVESGASNLAKIAAGLAPFAGFAPVIGSSLSSQPKPISPSVP